jgi:hypothetical protein
MQMLYILLAITSIDPVAATQASREREGGGGGSVQVVVVAVQVRWGGGVPRPPNPGLASSLIDPNHLV